MLDVYHQPAQSRVCAIQRQRLWNRILPRLLELQRYDVPHFEQFGSPLQRRRLAIWPARLEGPGSALIAIPVVQGARLVTPL